MSSSWLGLCRKTCIVTGGGSGIGQAVALSLLQSSTAATATTANESDISRRLCRVVLADQNYDALKSTEAKITSRLPPNIALESCLKSIKCDVTDSDQVQQLIETADEFAASDDGDNNDDNVASSAAATLLVNCAGITRDNLIGRMSEREWDEVLDVNLKATYLLCRHFCDDKRLQQFFPKKNTTMMNPSSSSSSIVSDPTTTTTNVVPTIMEGSIVNVGSIVSELGNVGQVNYSASKGGVLGLTRSLAKEMAHRNIRVNAVVPGFIDSPMSQAVPDHIQERIVKGIPMKRFGTPEEVANVVSFLLSPRSSYITGESIRVSGMISL